MTVKSALRSDQQVDVLLITQDLELKNRLVQIFLEKNHFALRTFNGTIFEVEDFLQTSKLPEILIADLNMARFPDTEALERLKKTKFATTPIIALSSYLDQDVVRSLMQMKIDDWLPKDSAGLDVYASCDRVFRAPEPKSASKSATKGDAVCYSFVPARGGAGNTMLAVQTAFLLGKGRMESTCLVDLNFQDGTVADYLDLTPAFKLDELSTTPGRLDAQLLDVMLTRHSSGLAVLATPRMPARHLEVSVGVVVSVLGLLSKAFETVIIDLPKSWYPWTDNVIWGSNKVFVTTTFSVPALRQARFVADAVIAKASADASVSVIVNRYDEPFFGSGLTRKDAETLLSNRLAGFLPENRGLVDEAINRGLPVHEVSAGSKLEKKLAEILGKSHSR